MSGYRKFSEKHNNHISLQGSLMSGHHKFSELTKDFLAERKRRIAAMTADAAQG